MITIADSSKHRNAEILRTALREAIERYRDHNAGVSVMGAEEWGVVIDRIDRLRGLLGL